MGKNGICPCCDKKMFEKEVECAKLLFKTARENRFKIMGELSLKLLNGENEYLQKSPPYFVGLTDNKTCVVCGGELINSCNHIYLVNRR